MKYLKAKEFSIKAQSLIDQINNLTLDKQIQLNQYLPHLKNIVDKIETSGDNTFILEKDNGWKGSGIEWMKVIEAHINAVK